MNRNIWIVLRREYLEVVRKKSFLISTFLVPLGFALIFAIQIVAALMVEKEHYTVLVYKEDLLTKNLVSSSVLEFQSTDLPEDEVRAKVLADKHLLALRLPNQDMLSREADPLVKVWGTGSMSKPVLKELDKKISEAVRAYKREKAGVTVEQQKSLEFKLDIQTEKLTKDGSKRTDSDIAMFIGIIMNMLIYIMLTIYGSQLMQSVIDEKSTRMVEVIVSSVKPFHLLMGKSLAIALVAITQMLMWVGLSTIVIMVGSLIAYGTVDLSSLQSMNSGGMGGGDVDPDAVMKMAKAINTFNWSVLWFLPFFFLGGFFLYGSLFAAAGSTVDNIQDASQYTMPVMIPIMLPVMFMQNVIQNPNGTFATFSSLFPFFSPMTMMVRMSLTEVPWWQVLLSMVLLLATFVGCIWIAAKVYRTGILMYGKKPSFKEIWKWIRY